MMFVDENADVWAKRYGISRDPRRCEKCGLELIPAIPFATQDCRGLKSVQHGCGSTYDLKRVVFIDPDLKDMYTELVGDGDDK